MAEKGIAYRLGWALYWLCLVLGVLNAGFWFWVGSSPPYFDLWDMIVLIGIPMLIAYSVGRLFRYVLSGE